MFTIPIEWSVTENKVFDGHFFTGGQTTASIPPLAPSPYVWRTLPFCEKQANLHFFNKILNQSVCPTSGSFSVLANGL